MITIFTQSVRPPVRPSKNFKIKRQSLQTGTVGLAEWIIDYSCLVILYICSTGSGSCPECGIALRRNNFRIQLFEDASIDKEVDIRKRILKDFCKKEEDFENLRDYNDYLEMIEDIIFNLSNNIDILETNKRIAEYKEKHKDQINKNRHRVSREALHLQDILAEEAKMNQLRLKETQREFMEEKKIKAENSEKLIDDLMFSEGDAKSIVNQHSQERAALAQQAVKFSTGANVRNDIVLQDIKPLVEAKKFVYEPPMIVYDGPAMPSEDELIQGQYYQFVRKPDQSELPGGFDEKIPCLRALQEAMDGLFYC